MSDDAQQLQITFPQGWGSVPNVPPGSPKLVCQGPDERDGYPQTFLLNFGPRGDMSFDEFSAQALAPLEQLDGFALIDTRDTTISGHPATLQEIQYRAQGLTLGALVWLGLTPQWAIHASYIAVAPLSAHDRSVADGIVASLHMPDEM